MNIRALLRPKLKVWLELPCACLIMNRSTAPKKMRGRKLNSRPKIAESPPEPLTVTLTRLRSTCASLSISTTDEPDSFLDSKVSPEKVVTVRESPLTSMFWICPREAMVMTSLMGSSFDPPRLPESRVNTTAVTPAIIRK